MSAEFIFSAYVSTICIIFVFPDSKYEGVEWGKMCKVLLLFTVFSVWRSLFEIPTWKLIHRLKLILGEYLFSFWNLLCFHHLEREQKGYLFTSGGTCNKATIPWSSPFSSLTWETNIWYVVIFCNFSTFQPPHPRVFALIMSLRAKRCVSSQRSYVRSQPSNQFLLPITSLS